MTIECSVAGVLEGANKLQDQEEVYQQVNDAYIRSIEMAGKRQEQMWRLYSTSPTHGGSNKESKLPVCGYCLTSRSRLTSCPAT